MNAMSIRSNEPTGHDLPAGLAAALRGDAERRGQRPEEFWSAQRAGIRARIVRGSERKPRGIWLSALAVAAIFLAVIFITPVRPRPEKIPARAVIDADQELLLAVEHSLAAGTPEALEPLTLLVESSVSNNEPESISHKEQRNEN
jgi:hypothetical protein